MVNLVEGFGDHRHPFEKGNKNSEEKWVLSAPGLSRTRKVKADQASVECFYCKKQRH